MIDHAGLEQQHMCLNVASFYYRFGKMEAHNFLRNRAKVRVLLSVEVTHCVQSATLNFPTDSVLFSGIFNFILQVMTGWHVNLHSEVRHLNENLTGCLLCSLPCRMLYMLRIAVVYCNSKGLLQMGNFQGQ